MATYPVFLSGNPMDRGEWWATVHGVTKVSNTTEWLNNNSETRPSGSRLQFSHAVITVKPKPHLQMPLNHSPDQKFVLFLERNLIYNLSESETTAVNMIYKVPIFLMNHQISFLSYKLSERRLISLKCKIGSHI